MVRFLHEFVEPGLALVKSVPPGIVGGHHHGAHAGAATLVVPEFIELQLQMLIEKFVPT